MDIRSVKQITISYEDYLDIATKRTNNPVMESEIPEMLKQAIKAGATVIVTNMLGNQSCLLKCDENGRFYYCQQAQGKGH
jgi:hypothetical protein